MTCPTRSLVAAAAFCLAASATYGAVASDLTLRLNDGTRVTVDKFAAVGESTVTVAAARNGIRIERTLPWSRIDGASFDGESYRQAELRQAFGLSADGADFVSHGGMQSLPEQSLPAPGMPLVAGRPCGPAVSGIVAPPFVDPQAYACGPPCCGAASFGWGLPCGAGPLPPMCVSCSPVPEAWLAFRPVGRVIGVRPDPLAAYADLAPEIYPKGIPTTESAFALGLLRERRRLETIAPIVAPVPGPPAFVPPAAVPAAPQPAGDVVPGKLSQIEARVTPLRPGGGADVSALGVTIVGFDAAGRPVPVEGTAQFTLYAGRQKLVRAFADVYAAKPTGLDRLGTWTRRVQPDASLVLRLAEPLPEHDPAVSSIGSLSVRLSMPGQGVFETIAEPITLRPASPLRDAIRSETGSRFLPDERTVGRRIDTWPHRPDLVGVE